MAAILLLFLARKYPFQLAVTAGLAPAACGIG
jgi:hypothetical protein